jgi:hypothetical protein
MLLRHILNEAPAVRPEEIAALKAALAGKISSLPDDETSAKALREIEDLLKHVNAGGKVGMINNALKSINDPTVDAARKEIARYINNIEMSPEQRDELFDLWRKDKLIKRNVLLSKGKHTFADIVNGYSSNPAIKTLVDELMKISALGQGKGEFGLSVLSKGINKPVGKGDLLIDDRKIEVKTFDKAAARFTDQEVIPAQGYDQAATDLNKFVDSIQPGLVEKSGLNLNKAIDLGITLQGSEQTKFYKMLSNLINIIFGGSKSDKGDVGEIMAAIKAGDNNAAKQAYARASFNYYMGMKDDEGVLSLNIGTQPMTVIYYRNADELAEMGQRFNAETIYLTSKTFREVYPKISIVDTTFGANAAAKAQRDAEKQAAKDAKAASKTAKSGTVAKPAKPDLERPAPVKKSTSNRALK